MYGQAHDVEVGALEPGDADVAYPFLDAVGSGFVQGVVVVYVVFYLLLGEGGEGDVTGAGEAVCEACGGEGDACYDLMGAAGEAGEHLAGFFLGTGFAQNLAVQTDDGVCGDEQFGVCEGVGAGFLLADVLGYFGGRQVGRVGFIYSGDDSYLVGDS